MVVDDVLPRTDSGARPRSLGALAAIGCARPGPGCRRKPRAFTGLLLGRRRRRRLTGPERAVPALHPRRRRPIGAAPAGRAGLPAPQTIARLTFRSTCTAIVRRCDQMDPTVTTETATAATA